MSHFLSIAYAIQVVQEQNDELRSMYHQIEKAEIFETVEEEIMERLRDISTTIKQLAKTRFLDVNGDLKDRIGRLKTTLYEVQDQIHARLARSHIDALFSSFDDLSKIPPSELHKSRTKIEAILELHKKRATELQYRRFSSARAFAKQTIIVLDITTNRLKASLESTSSSGSCTSQEHKEKE